MSIKNVSIKERQGVEIKIENNDGSIKTVVVHNVNPVERTYLDYLVEDVAKTDRWRVNSFNHEVLDAARIVNISVAAMKRMIDDNPDGVWESEFEEALLSSVEFDQNIVVTPQDILNQLVWSHDEDDQHNLRGLAAEAILDDGQMSPDEIDHMPDVVGYQFWSLMDQFIMEQLFDGLRVQDDTELRAVSVTKAGRVLMAIVFDLKGITDIY